MNRRPRRHCRLIERLETRQFLSTVTVANATGSESVGSLAFHVTLDAAADHDVTLKYVATPAGRSATPNKDYVPARGTLTLAAGQTAGDITVTLKDDSAHESAETFRLRLNATGAKLANATATGTITDDDAAPAVTLGDVTTKEGNGGRHVAVVTATLAKPAGVPVTFKYATSDETPYYLAASAGADYGAAKGSLTFRPGRTKQTIRIPIVGDRLEESDETFRVTLTQEGDEVAAASVTIKDDDTASKKDAPVLSVSDTSALEGDDGDTVAGFTVTLSRPADKDVTFRYAYPAATAGGDESPLTLTPGYVPASGTFTIPAHQTTATIFIKIHGDTTYEANQTFEVRLSNVKNARPINGRDAVSANFQVVDDEPLLFADADGNYVAGITSLALPSDSLISYYDTGDLNVPVLLSRTALVAAEANTLTRFPDYTLTAVGSNAYVFDTGNYSTWEPISVTAGVSTIGAGTLTLGGQTIAANNTYYGDANIDGLVDADDYALILHATRVQSTAGWVGGDYNYDGVVDSADYLLIDRGTVAQNGSLSADLLRQREAQFGTDYASQLTGGVQSSLTLSGASAGSMTVVGRTLNFSNGNQAGVSNPTEYTLLAATVQAVPLSALAGIDLPTSSLRLLGTTPDAVRALLVSAFNNGTWSSPDTPVTPASSDPDHRTALGYATQSDGSVLVKPALYGDANLDGVVDDADRAIVQESLSNPPAAPSWSAGDFNYDNRINSDDLAVFDRNFGCSL